MRVNKLFRYIKKSVPGPERFFASRSDYINVLLESKGNPYKTEDELLSDHFFIKAIVTHWLKSGQIGCRFAQFFASNFERFGWTLDVTDYDFDSINIQQARLIEKNIVEKIRNSKTEVFSLIFPRIFKFTQVTNLILSLVQGSNFFIESSVPYQDQQLVALRYDLTGKNNFAWVMFLGPFENIPKTRRAPFFQIVIRTKKKDKSKMYRLARDVSDAHNADMPVNMLPIKMQDNLWRQSFISTRLILGHKPGIHAAARYTVSIPNYLWEKIEKEIVNDKIYK